MYVHFIVTTEAGNCIVKWDPLVFLSLLAQHMGKMYGK